MRAVASCAVGSHGNLSVPAILPVFMALDTEPRDGLEELFFMRCGVWTMTIAASLLKGRMDARTCDLVVMAFQARNSFNWG
jgi:hypothetical protein